MRKCIRLQLLISVKEVMTVRISVLSICCCFSVVSFESVTLDFTKLV